MEASAVHVGDNTQVERGVVKKTVDDEAFDRWWKGYRNITTSTLFEHADTIEIAKDTWKAGVEWCDEQERE